MDIQITIAGTTPLLCNKFTDAAQMAASAGSRSSIANDHVPPLGQAEARLYRAEDAEGTLIIPQPNISRCIIDAGSFFKTGRTKITTQKSSLLAAAVFISPIAIPIVSESGWKVDTRPVRIPATGGRILCHRPCFDDWRLDFTAMLDEEMISPRLFREIVDAAGKRVGLGDFRPGTKGPFGRFVVTSWAEE